MLGISKSKESLLLNFQFRIYLINLYIFETILPPGSGSATLNFLQPLTFSEAKDDIIFIDKASSTTVKQRKKEQVSVPVIILIVLSKVLIIGKLFSIFKTQLQSICLAFN